MSINAKPINTKYLIKKNAFANFLSSETSYTSKKNLQEYIFFVNVFNVDLTDDMQCLWRQTWHSALVSF